VRQKHISDLLIFHNDSVNIPFSFEKVTRYEHMKFCLFLLHTACLYMVCCVVLAVKLLNNYWPRKSARTFAIKQKASNKLYMGLALVTTVTVW